MISLYDYLQNVFWTMVCLFIIRIFIVYLRVHKKKKIIYRYKLTSKLMIVLGSGGHTFEILHLIRNIRDKIRPRIYVLADSDLLSEQKAKAFEERIKNSLYPDLFIIEKIPRSREVGQSWITTIFTTLKAFIVGFCIVIKHKPDAILCNGPGTCVPLCLSAVLIHILGLKHITIIYIESICRVKTLSLTGKILYYIADHYIVHWPELKEKYPRAEYFVTCAFFYLYSIRFMYSLFSSLDGTEENYLFMDQSNSDEEDGTEFDYVPENITEDKCDELFMLSDNENF